MLSIYSNLIILVFQMAPCTGEQTAIILKRITNLKFLSKCEGIAKVFDCS